MDRPSVQHSRSPRQAIKSKKKPIKVVYISNPMKVKTHASNFRALVQSLTGRDSDPADVKKILAMDGVHEFYRVPHDHDLPTDDKPSPVMRLAAMADHERESSASTGSSSSSTASFELFDDDVFTQEMLENFTGFPPPPSHLLFETPGDVFRSLDVV